MLGTLDPHSSFFTPKEYAQMRERQEGHYYGIGITIRAVDGDITALSVFEGSPAYKKGIRTRRRHRRRSPARTRRAGRPSRRCRSCAARRARRSASRSSAAATTQPIPVELTRDEVDIPTVPAYFMIDATTGYIRMQDFGENTDRDVKHALHDLPSKGMRRLLFDIRGNPGGPLDQAIKVANEFLPRGKMIVYTRGRVAELGSGLPRDRGQRVHRHPDRDAGESQQRERVGDRHRRAAGSRSRVSSSARRRSARRSCSRCTASAAAPAWR